MPNRYDNDRDNRPSRATRQQGQDYRTDRQPEQFQDDYRQHNGDSDSNRYGDVSSRYQGGFGQGDYDPLGDYDRASGTQSYFRGDRSGGGGDFSGGTFGGYRSATPSRSGNERSIPPRRYEEDDRGMFDKATDEVMSWFGDDDASRRRRMDHSSHRGKGPSNYKRSPERLLEDACERLTHDPYIDARNVNVTVAENEVTLDGTVNSRDAKRRAEDCVNDISGVKHVQNNLRVDESKTSWNAASSSDRNDVNGS